MYRPRTQSLLPQTESAPDVMMDINTTPLIDVMLVLLIMLIVTIPIQLHAVKLDMPKPAPPQLHEVPPVVRIRIDDSSRIYFDEQEISAPADITAKLSEYAANDVQPEIHVRVHADARYEVVARMMAAAQRAGLRKIGFTDTQAFR